MLKPPTSVVGVCSHVQGAGAPKHNHIKCGCPTCEMSLKAFYRCVISNRYLELFEITGVVGNLDVISVGKEPDNAILHPDGTPRKWQDDNVRKDSSTSPTPRNRRRPKASLPPLRRPPNRER